MNGKQQGSLRATRPFLATFLVLGMGVLAGCEHPPANDQQLQEQAARATEAAKRESAKALADTRVAAANAERAVNDVAAGVKQGLHDKTPGGEAANGRLDLNAASRSELSSLPGISDAKAAQIIRHRPYAKPRDLVKSGVLTESQFERIDPKVTVE